MDQKYREEIWPLREGLNSNDPEAVRRAQDINAKYAKPSPTLAKGKALAVAHDCGKGIVYTYTFGGRWCTACGDLKG